MTDKAQSFSETVHFRRSVRLLNAAGFDADAVTRCLELALLAPNSSNMQLWEFYRIRSAEAKKAVAEACLNQNAAITAQELVVVVTRPDLWKQRADYNYKQVEEIMPGKKSLTGVSTLTYYKKLMPMLYFNDPLGIWSFCKKTGQFFLGLVKPTIREVGGSDVRIVVQKSAALAAQTFMLGMAAEGQDTCPMEGYDSVRLKRILKLPRRAAINMVIGCGKRQPDGVYGPRLRVPNETVIFTL